MQISAGQRDQIALDATSKLLKQNPEYYTMWNHRRRILESQLLDAIRDCPEGTDVATSVAEIIATDLRFLIPLMQKYPKCYWLWNHRAWLLQQASTRLPSQAALEFWTQELALDSKMLQQDKRNFHGWGYRRQVISELERLKTLQGVSGLEASMVDSELAYTRKMIGQDLSNFSAWHTRSKLILKLLGERGENAAARKEMLDQGTGIVFMDRDETDDGIELDLIHEALIDPRDQSVWYYHQFLMTAFEPKTAAGSIAPDLSAEERKAYLDAELEYVLEALEGAEEVKWIYLSLIQLASSYKAVTSEWPQSVTESQVKKWVLELSALDPPRDRRWLDLRQSLDTGT